MTTTMKSLVLLVCAVACFTAGSCRKKTNPPAGPSLQPIPGSGHAPTEMEWEAFEKIHPENPGNLHVRIRNTGSKKLSEVTAAIGQFRSIPCELEPSTETEHLFRRYPSIEPLTVSYKDDEGKIYARSVEKLYTKMPKTMKGNFNLTFYIDSNANEMTVTNEDED